MNFFFQIRNEKSVLKTENHSLFKPASYYKWYKLIKHFIFFLLGFSIRYIYIYMYEDFFPQFHSNIAIFPTLDGPGPWNQRVKKSLRKPRFLRFCYLVNVYQGISCYLNKSTWHHACITLPGWPILKCRLWWYNCIKML